MRGMKRWGEERILRRVLWGMALLAVGWLVTGCRMTPRPAPVAGDAAELAVLLPGDWTPLGRARVVTLNGPETAASLLLFRFDMGQIGAMIVEGTPPTPARVDWLLPRHFGPNTYLGQGMIAPPEMDAGDIDLVEVDTGGALTHERELVIRAGRSHLTFVWWDAATSAYGVTQLVAPGGFGGVDWEAWEEEPEVLTRLSGRMPLDDYRARSQICQEVVYVRRSDLPGIVFDARPVGLAFCRGEVPAQPFYAEGVVLAYLLWPRPAGEALTKLLTPGVTLPQLDAELAYDRLVIERVEDIRAHLTLPLPGAGALPAGGATTPVCVELAERANPSVRRWVVLTLRYIRTEGPAYLSGRWTVSSARMEPPPIAPTPGYCAEVLARSVP